jgi:hypothetical protein
MQESSMQEPSMQVPPDMQVPSIFRFKFNEEIINLINNFAIIHQNDDRKTYKEEWSKWFIENNAIFEEEITRLTRLGYLGNIEYKMFNAGRYYFRKKELKGKDIINYHNDGININKKRRIYTPINHEVINAMDNHIRASILNADKKLKFKPADGYDDFCKTHINLLKPIIKQMIYNQIESSSSSSSSFSELSNNNNNNNNDISLIIISKIKKTYKNRYFIITHK